MSREKMTAGIVADLVELPDDVLAMIRGLVAEVKAAAIARGTARKLDGATLAREQAEREARPCCPCSGVGREGECGAAFRTSRTERPKRGEECGCTCHRADGFGCHHEPPCASACPVPSFPPVDGFETREEAQEECDAANEPIGDRQILALAALDWNMRQAGEQ